MTKLNELTLNAKKAYDEAMESRNALINAICKKAKAEDRKTWGTDHEGNWGWDTTLTAEEEAEIVEANRAVEAKREAWKALDKELNKEKAEARAKAEGTTVEAKKAKANAKRYATEIAKAEAEIEALKAKIAALEAKKAEAEKVAKGE